MCRPLLFKLLFVMIGFSVSPRLVAQVPWPEKAENLKVLPSSTTQAELRRTMFGFSNALGVRCAHCHVAENLRDLSTYDFSSDAKATKTSARIMMRMVERINDVELAKLGERPAANRVTCATCHAGKERPRSLEETLMAVIDTSDIGAALSRYRELRERYYGSAAYDFSENTLNRLGYRLMGEERLEDALEIFKLNVEFHPDRWNPYDSLAEAYLKAGNKWLAIINYSRSLELNPRNSGAAEALEGLIARDEEK